MTQRAVTGIAGERLAQGFLESKQFAFVDRNWRCRTGEIDLVMLDGEVLVFVEVKTRRTRSMGTAEESVTSAKGAKLLATGEWFIAAHPEFEDRIWRIDIVAVTMDRDGEAIQVTHLTNAVTAG